MEIGSLDIRVARCHEIVPNDNYVGSYANKISRFTEFASLGYHYNECRDTATQIV